MCKHALVLDLGLRHFCSPDNINSAYHITIKARGELSGRLKMEQFMSSLQINHRVARQLLHKITKFGKKELCAFKKFF